MQRERPLWKRIRLIGGEISGEVSLLEGPTAGGKVSFGLDESDRKALTDLFVELEKRRAIFEAPHGREDQESHVTGSLRELRDQHLPAAARALEGRTWAAHYVAKLREAADEYLTAVEGAHRAGRIGEQANQGEVFTKALVELRDVFRLGANHFASDVHNIEPARRFAEKLSRRDRLAAPRAR